MRGERGDDLWSREVRRKWESVMGALLFEVSQRRGVEEVSKERQMEMTRG